MSIKRLIGAIGVALVACNCGAASSRATEAYLSENSDSSSCLIPSDKIGSYFTVSSYSDATSCQDAFRLRPNASLFDFLFMYTDYYRLLGGRTIYVVFKDGRVIDLDGFGPEDLKSIPTNEVDAISIGNSAEACKAKREDVVYILSDAGSGYSGIYLLDDAIKTLRDISYKESGEFSYVILRETLANKVQYSIAEHGNISASALAGISIRPHDGIILLKNKETGIGCFGEVVNAQIFDTANSEAVRACRVVRKETVFPLSLVVDGKGNLKKITTISELRIGDILFYFPCYGVGGDS